MQLDAYPRNNMCYGTIKLHTIYCIDLLLYLFFMVVIHFLDFLEYKVFNFSTGRIIDKAVFDSEVTAMDHDHTGQLIFCGDAQVCVLIHLLSFHKCSLNIFHSVCFGSAGIYIHSQNELAHG